MSTSSERRYLSIGEVLGLLQEEFPDVTISKIRFLESQGLIDPERTASGYRKFYPDDITRLRFILREQKEHFLPLKVIRDRLEEKLKSVDEQPVTQSPVVEAEEDPATVVSVDDEAAAPAAAMVAPVDGGGDTPSERLPVWMTQRPRSRNPLLTGGAEGSGASYSAAELAEASGLTAAQVAQAEQFGLLVGRQSGRETFFDPDALVAARAIAGFLRLGIEPRHLRTFKTASDREVGLYEQLILPLVKQRNTQSRSAATERLNGLVDLGTELRTALLRQGLRHYLD